MVFAGCVGNDSPKVRGSEDGEVSMAEVLPIARAKALEWKADAKLMSAFGTEVVVDPTKTKPNADELWFSHSGELAPDPIAGNGELTGWSFTFIDPDDRAILSLVLNANGTQVERRQVDSERDRTYNETGVKWAIDSDDAMATAQANATFVDGIARIDFPRYSYSLARLSTNNPYLQRYLDEMKNETPELRGIESVWGIYVTGRNVGEWLWASAAVDAQTGRLLYAERSRDADSSVPISEPPTGPTPRFEPWEYEDEETGTMSVVARTRNILLPIEAAHATVSLVMQFGRQFPLASVSWALLDPNGVVVVEGDTAAVGDGDTALWEGNLIEAGTYTIRLSLGEGGAAVDYNVRIWAWGLREVVEGEE